ncbi:MAG: radical SAM protein [Deltaproteobacteria bacterium]|nr:MAG: radical SAM protein [Deltaproteobacteria bacterium]
MKKKPLIIPIFIPQEGCPHRCVYCDQATISGVSQPSWSPIAVREQVQSFLDGSRRRYPVQVAFYGGSFTLMSEARQRQFLEPVQEFLKRGQVHSLRLSTRPDAIEVNNLRFLQTMGVKTIELGAQSLNDKVLSASARGHSSRQVHEATQSLRQHGFEVGLQLMPGLPGDDWETFMQTVEETIVLHPSFIRLYPTVVLSSTPLERLYKRGLYLPLSLSEAIDWCKEAKKRFSRATIPIIRMGLQPTVSLELPGRVIDGPYHPAFGHLVNSAIWNERISPVLQRASRQSPRLVILAPSHQLADIRGHRNGNINRWLTELRLTSLETVADDQIGVGEFRVITR